MTRRGLAASLIVRDETRTLTACLGSLADLVDEIHVHDTGSTDGTPELAAELGAKVTRGRWTDDFAAARNAALLGWTSDWVLSIDADEQLITHAPALRELLDHSTAGALLVDIDNVEDTGGFTQQSLRLFRPALTSWEGRVHEQVIGRDEPLRFKAAPREVIVLSHDGYRTATLLRAKGLRNAPLAQAALDQLALDASPDTAKVAATLLDLGRSLMAAGRSQDAVDTFEAIRDMFPGTPEWLMATDFLARMLLSDGLDEAGLILSEELRRAGARTSYCDWLAAQALVQLGFVEQARTLLSRIDDIIDPAGRRHCTATLHQLTALVARLR